MKRQPLRTKSETPWKGPFRIVEVWSPLTVRLHGNPASVNIRDLKPYYRRNIDWKIGDRVRVWWDGDRRYDKGTIVAIDHKNYYKVKYDDGDIFSERSDDLETTWQI
ncbi:MAG: hypothetical protein CUN57_01645 [Phototrophicales bacterium]|nr:MAG: hypothetical protein CUN57_01645 [Phototrophicales bacterium]